MMQQQEYPVLAALGRELTQLSQAYREMRPLTGDEVQQAVSQLETAFVPVLVPEAWINGLGHLRALGRNGIQAVVADPNPKALSFYSRYAIPYQCKPFLNQTPEGEAAFIKELCGLGERIRSTGRTPVLFMLAAERLLAMFVRHQAELKRVFLLTSNYETQLRLEDKREQYRVAQQAGVDVPHTVYVDSREDFERSLPELVYPCLVKPRGGKEFYSRFHCQVMRVTTPEEAREAFERAQDFKLMFQEEIPGEDTELFTLGSYVDAHTRPLGLFTGYKLRGNHKYGTCALGISCEAPEVAAQGMAFLRQAGYHGASQVEFKRDPRDGRLKFLEINNRLWKWHSLTAACGVNLPYLQYLDAIGQAPTELPQQVNGVRWWLPWMDLWSVMKQVKAGEVNLDDYLREISFDFVDGVGSWDDPLPALVNFFGFGWMMD